MTTDYIILFDTEYTAWEGSQQRKWSKPWEHREVIQIAALKVRVNQGISEEASFDSLVKPVRNALLSDYITGLTGITQQDIDTQGQAFPAVFHSFYCFCENGRYPLYSWGDDPGVLRENCELSGLIFDEYLLKYNDIRTVLEQGGIDTRPYCSGTVHRALGLSLSLTEHNALNDVRSLAATLAELSRLQRLVSSFSTPDC